MTLSKAVVSFMKKQNHFQNIKDEMNFDSYFELFFSYFDQLKEYEIEGIYFLLVIPDSLGIYTVENSKMIIKMMHVIQPYIPRNMAYYQNIINLFEESVREQQNITVA